MLHPPHGITLMPILPLPPSFRISFSIPHFPLRTNIIYNYPQDPGIGKEEQYARNPEAGDKGADAVEFELEALLEPKSLGCDPESCGRDTEEGFAEERRHGEVEGKEDLVPEEILLFVS